MPIRFRCPHCQQLLGIARRKAGTRVDCPTCHAAVLVPATDQVDAPPQPATGPVRPPLPPTAPAPPAADEPMFERSDFEQMFAPPQEEPPRASPPPAPFPALGPAVGGNGSKPSQQAPEPYPSAPGTDMIGSPGYLLTPRRASLLTVIVILMMALAFVGGLLVGRFLL